MVLNTPSLDIPCAILTSKTNKIKMSLFTDQPALQFYTGSYLNEQFHRYQGVCLEAQGYPDAINVNHFPPITLMVGETYKREIVYQFELI